MTHRLACTKIGAALVCLSAATASYADTVSGQLSLDGNTLKPSEVAAFRVRDNRDPRERATFVMLTTKPVDHETIAKDTDPYASAINDDAVRDADFITLRVGPTGIATMNASIGEVQFVDSSGEIMRQPGSLVSSCATNTPKRVVCSVKTKQTVRSASGASWSLDVQFDSEVLARTPGKALPKDGGEPGKAFVALAAVAGGDDVQKIIPLLAPDEAVRPEYMTEAEHHASIRQKFEYGFPTQPTISGGELVDENTALLDVEGARPGRRDLYEIRMERAEGRWGFRYALQLGKLPD